MKRAFLATLLVAGTASSFASADDKAVCLDAADKGQTARSAHHLREAREQFRRCVRKECPAVVQKDCATWLESVGAQMPTVIVRAKDATGADIIDVRVTVDGNAFSDKLDGQAVAMDPGAHAFHFEMADGTKVDRQVLIVEAQKNQTVEAVLQKGGPPPAASSGNAAPAPVDQTRASGGSSTWKTIGWVAGAVGVVGLGAGIAFGAVAMNDKNSAGCDGDTHTCVAGPLHDARNAATISDVGFIAGGVLVAAGLGLVLFGPSGSKEATATVRLVPSVALHGGGLVVGGAFR